MIRADIISSTRIREIESLVEHRIPWIYHKQKEEGKILELKRHEQEEPGNPFHNWSMPEPEPGYIKPKKGDLL